MKSTTPNTSFLLRMCFSPFMFRAKQSDYTLPNSFDHIPRPLSVRRYFCNRERGLSGIVYSIIPSESISLILNLSLPESECCPMSTASSALLNSPLAKLDNILSSTDLGPDLGPRWISDSHHIMALKSTFPGRYSGVFRLYAWHRSTMGAKGSDPFDTVH